MHFGISQWVIVNKNEDSRQWRALKSNALSLALQWYGSNLSAGSFRQGGLLGVIIYVHFVCLATCNVWFELFSRWLCHKSREVTTTMHFGISQWVIVNKNEDSRQWRALKSNVLSLAWQWHGSNLSAGSFRQGGLLGVIIYVHFVCLATCNVWFELFSRWLCLIPKLIEMPP